MKRLTWQWLKLGLLIGGLAAIALALRAAGMGWTSLTPERLRAAIAHWGWWSPAAFFLLYAQPVVPLPFTVVAASAGLAFGMVGGGALLLLAATTRGCIHFLLARTCGRGAVQSLLKGRLASWDARLGRNGFATVCWIRLVPNFPYDMQNLGLGCTQVSLGAFVLGTLVGLLPGVVLWVAIGRMLLEPARRGPLAALGLLLAAGWLVQRRLRARAAGSDAAAPAAVPPVTPAAPRADAVA